MAIFCFCLVIVCIIEGIIIKGLMDCKKSSIKEKIDFFRTFWGNFVIYVLATSIIGLLLGSIYFKQLIGLNEINSWVSIVLGLVALIIGIISLFLSFYNVDQSIETQKQTMDIMENVKKEIQEKIGTLGTNMQQEFKDLHKEVSDYRGQAQGGVIVEEPHKDDWGIF